MPILVQIMAENFITLSPMANVINFFGIIHATFGTTSVKILRLCANNALRRYANSLPLYAKLWQRTQITMSPVANVIKPFLA